MSTVEETKTNENEVLEPNYKVRYQTIGQAEHAHVYAQRPLSFFGKMELFSLLGATVNEAMKKGDISIADLLESPSGNISNISTNELKEADTFIRAVAKLVEFAPDFLKDLYCLALSVPKGERDYVKELMELPEDEGGLNDNDGMEILDTFIEQNWEAMFDFFGNKIVPLIQKISNKAQDSAPSKPSKATRTRTQKQ